MTSPETRTVRSNRASIRALIAVVTVGLLTLSGCVGGTNLPQSNAQRILDDAVGDAGTVEVTYDDAFMSGVTCTASARLTTTDPATVTAIAAALATIELDDVMPKCTLWISIGFDDSPMRMRIDAATASRVPGSDWAAVVAYALEHHATSIDARPGGRDAVDVLDVSITFDGPPTTFAALIDEIDPALRSQPPGTGFSEVLFTARSCLDCTGDQLELAAHLPVSDAARAALDAVAALASNPPAPVDRIGGDLELLTYVGYATQFNARLNVVVDADRDIVDPPLRPETMATADAILGALEGSGLAFSLSIEDSERTVLSTSGP